MNHCIFIPLQNIVDQYIYIDELEVQEMIISRREVCMIYSYIFQFTSVRVSPFIWTTWRSSRTKQCYKGHAMGKHQKNGCPTNHWSNVLQLKAEKCIPRPWVTADLSCNILTNHTWSDGFRALTPAWFPHRKMYETDPLGVTQLNHNHVCCSIQLCSAEFSPAYGLSSGTRMWKYQKYIATNQERVV